MKLEKVQRAATRCVPTLRELNYEERERGLGERWIRVYMRTMYKCMMDKEKLDVEDLFTRNTTLRGQCMKLKKRRRDDVQKYNFPNRRIEIWNALPEEVGSANSIKTLKNDIIIGCKKTRYCKLDFNL